MPKLKNVTEAEMDVLVIGAGNISADARNHQSRLEQGYYDFIPEPLAKASALLSASRSLADMAAWLLAKAAVDEQERVLEAKMRERALGIRQ